MSVVSIGEVVVDWLSTDTSESLDQAQHFYRSLGGNASNVAIGLARLGTASRLVGVVGNDIHGAYLSKVLSMEGVDTQYLVCNSTYPTAQCYVLTTDDGEHFFYNWPKPHAADMLVPDNVVKEMFDGFSVLHATGISFMLNPRRDAVVKAIGLAKKLGLMVSFDAGFPTGSEPEAKELIEATLYQADILKFNLNELKYWYGREDSLSVEEVANQLFNLYQPIVLAVTLAQKGSILVTEHGVVTCPSFSVQFANGVGAGDAFIAGMLHTICQHLGSDVGNRALRSLSSSQWMKIGLFANAVGALATTVISASEGLPRPQAVMALLNRMT